jgi:hypothetical protein
MKVCDVFGRGRVFESLSTGASGRLLRKELRTSEFHRGGGISELKVRSVSIDLVIVVRDPEPINEIVPVRSGLGESCRTRQTRLTMSRIFAITFSNARAFVGQFAENSVVCHFLLMSASTRRYYLGNGILKFA